MDIVKNVKDVEKRLFKVYGNKLAIILFGSWCKLAICGEEKFKEKVNKATYYRYIKLLKEANVSWLDTDIMVRDKITPEGFSPIKSDKRRL